MTSILNVRHDRSTSRLGSMKDLGIFFEMKKTSVFVSTKGELVPITWRGLLVEGRDIRVRTIDRTSIASSQLFVLNI